MHSLLQLKMTVSPMDSRLAGFIPPEDVIK